MNHKLLIEMGPASSDELRVYWEAMCEGLVEMNAHWMADHRSEIEGPVPRYEDPRVVRCGEEPVADQALGAAWVIHKRGTATCFDWCAYVAALRRLNGDLKARVILIDEVGEYERAIPYRYHALVEATDPQGRTYILDATQDLPGYQGSDEWWADHGHCCIDCALGLHAEEQPCEECDIAAQAAGCPDGTCGLKGRIRKGRM